jgi:glycosyltransferase involved in cell wall biosynthesis
MDLSIVIPVRNEAENVAPLVGEIRAALAGALAYEIIYVDDGSEDATAVEIMRLAAGSGDPRLLRHARRNAVRRRLLGDDTPDAGCGLKLFPRQLFLDLPAFDHMHRFLPALARQVGASVRSVPVNHRPRRSGVSKYGVFDRLGVGIVDLFGMLWLQRRALRPLLLGEAPAEVPAAALSDPPEPAVPALR